MVCALRLAAMPVSAVDRIVFYFLQDLVSNIHGAESIDFGNRGRRIGQDSIAETFQLHTDGVDLRYGGVGKRDGFFAVRGLDIERKDVNVLWRLELDDLRFLVEKIDANIAIFLEQAHFAHLLHGYPAGGEVGDAAVVEFDADAGDIGGIGDHG